MRSLLTFAAYFVVVSALTAIVNALVINEKPARIARESFRFFTMVILGILALSVVVWALEWMFIPG